MRLTALLRLFAYLSLAALAACSSARPSAPTRRPPHNSPHRQRRASAHPDRHRPGRRRGQGLRAHRRPQDAGSQRPRPGRGGRHQRGQYRRRALRQRHECLRDAGKEKAVGDEAQIRDLQLSSGGLVQGPEAGGLRERAGPQHAAGKADQALRGRRHAAGGRRTHRVRTRQHRPGRGASSSIPGVFQRWRSASTTMWMAEWSAPCPWMRPGSWARTS